MCKSKTNIEFPKTLKLLLSPDSWTDNGGLITTIHEAERAKVFDKNWSFNDPRFEINYKIKWSLDRQWSVKLLHVMKHWQKISRNWTVRVKTKFDLLSTNSMYRLYGLFIFNRTKIKHFWKNIQNGYLSSYKILVCFVAI